MKLFQNLFENNIGIDLGTENMRVWAKGRGLVLDEPAVVAISLSTRRVLGVGADAEKIAKGVSIVRILYGIGSDAAYTSPRDRRMEAEADRLGVRYLARAGYDPEAMVRLFEWFERIAPEDKESILQLFRSHPFHSERIDHVREVLQEPDLYEMPQPSLGDRLKEKADEVDLTDIHPIQSATNAWSQATGIATNLTSKLPKLPWGSKGKPEDAREDERASEASSKETQEKPLPDDGKDLFPNNTTNHYP